MTASARSPGVWRALLAALFICVSVVSGATVARPAVEYSCSLSQRTGLALAAPMARPPQLASHGRVAAAQASVAALHPVAHRDLNPAGEGPAYDIATSGSVGGRADHDYEATGPPTTRNARSA